MSATLFQLFSREVVPSHVAEVELWEGRAREAVLGALSSGLEEDEAYARACREAVQKAEREAKAAFRAAWSTWVAWNKPAKP